MRTSPFDSLEFGVNSDTGTRTDITEIGQRAVVVLLVVSGLLLALWSFVVPIFETPDEVHHWQYARYIHDHGRLPLYGPSFVEANSPPIYYVLIAPVATPTAVPPPAVWHDGRERFVVPFEPRWELNAGDDYQRYWPIRTARLLTALMSVVTVLAAYLAGRDATGLRCTGILAAGLVALLPQFTFRGSSVSNDALVAMFSAVTTWLTVRLVRRGFTWRRGAWASVALAAGYLTKISAICLVPALALAMLSAGGSIVDRTRRLVTFGLALLLVGPWSWRNVVLYGDPFASGAMHVAVANIITSQPLTSPYFLTTFPYLLSRSFVGYFGWMNLPMPEWIYFCFWTLGGVAVLGLVRAVVQDRRQVMLVGVLLLLVLSNLAVVVHLNRTFAQPQGRYLFPAIASVAVLTALGLEALPGWRRAGSFSTVILLILLTIANVLVLVKVVRPAYYPAVMPRLSTAVMTLDPGAPIDLVADKSAAGYIVTGDDPQLSFPIDLDTQAYGFLQFEISGEAPSVGVTGSVYFALDHKLGSESQRIDFEWLADNKRRNIIIPLLKNRFWRQRATMLRIDPFNSGGRGVVGAHVAVLNLTLHGSLPVTPM